MSFLIIISLLLAFTDIVYSNPLVHSNVGWIEGLEAKDGSYNMFLGIPYGLVDENNVFGKAVPHPPFKENFQAFEDLPFCPQITSGRILGESPNCLQLNVYVPKSASHRNRLPVMVWIHGGSFVSGNAKLEFNDPKFLVKQDVIVVSIHYRVGIYGFLCMDIPEVPGNQGLKDTHLALRWVKDNIYGFFGDPDRITLFGNSAGARTIDFHILSSTEKLFNNVILQSGTTLDSGWLINKIPDAPLKILNHLGYDIDDPYEALDIMSGLDSTTVVKAASELNYEFKPCIEKEFDGVESFITEYPVNIKNIPKANNLSVIIGTNSQEMLTRFVNNFATNDPFRERLADYFDFDNETLQTVERIVREFYIADKDISEPAKWDIMDFDSDIMYVVSSRRQILKLVENNAIVYNYLFNYNGGRNHAKSPNNVTVGGTAHSDEIGYLFDMTILHDTQQPQDLITVDMITTMWTNFAKTGNPTPELSSLLPITWTPRTKGSLEYYMDLNSTLSIRTKPFNRRMMFWELFFEAYGKYQKGFKELS